MGSVLIKNGRIWDGTRFFHGDVLTHGNVIEKIDSEIEENTDFVFDAVGKTVSAGLVDAHVHMKGISATDYCIDATASCISFGVTAAVDASGSMGDKALLDSFLVKNRVFVCAVFRGNKAYFDSTLDMLQKYGEKAVGIKAFYDTQISEVTDIVPLRQVVDFANRHGLIVMVHSSHPPIPMAELLDVLRPGDILTHAYHGGKHNVSEDGFACIEKAKKRGVVIDAGLAGYVHTDFGVFRDAIANGAIPDIISTDITRYSAYKRGGRYGLPMCMSIAKHLGMEEADIFRAVTSNPARSLGMDEHWGALQQGRVADIAVLEYADEGFDMTDTAGNRICSETGYRNVLTVASGEIVYRH